MALTLLLNLMNLYNNIKPLNTILIHRGHKDSVNDMNDPVADGSIGHDHVGIVDHNITVLWKEKEKKLWKKVD